MLTVDRLSWVSESTDELEPFNSDLVWEEPMPSFAGDDELDTPGGLYHFVPAVAVTGVTSL